MIRNVPLFIPSSLLLLLLLLTPPYFSLIPLTHPPPHPPPSYPGIVHDLESDRWIHPAHRRDKEVVVRYLHHQGGGGRFHEGDPLLPDQRTGHRPPY